MAAGAWATQYRLAEAAAAFHGYKPLAVLDDVINAFHDYVCDTADAVEQTLKKVPELSAHHTQIEQGIDLWQLKLQRAADVSFDQFESEALCHVFHVPFELEQEEPAALPDCTDEDEDETDLSELLAQLQHGLAMRHELQRKLSAARREKQLWESRRAHLQRVVSACEPSAVQNMLHTAEELRAMLKGLEQSNVLQLALSGDAPRLPLLSASRAATNKHHFVVPKRLLQHREPISTVSIADLQQLSSMLCA